MLLCSEMIAEVHKNTGLLDKSLTSQEILPAMWDTTRRLQLPAGVSLSKEHVIFGPKTLEDRSKMGYPAREDPRFAGFTFPLDTSESLGAGGFYGVDVSRPINSVNPLAAPAMVAMSPEGYTAMKDS